MKIFPAKKFVRLLAWADQQPPIVDYPVKVIVFVVLVAFVLVLVPLVVLEWLFTKPTKEGGDQHE